MNLISLMHDHLSILSKTEGKLAHYILENPEEIVYMSTQELAKKSEVSPATVSRLAKSLGLEGFPQLKIELSANLKEIKDARFSDIVPHDDYQIIKDKIQNKLIRAIKENTELLNLNKIQTFIEMIHEKEVIYVFGIGASNIAAQDFTQKFLRIGKKVFFFNESHLLLTSMATNQESSFLFLISNSGEKSEIKKLAQIARDLHYPVVGLTSKNSSPLSQLSDLTILTSKGQEASLRSSATNSLLIQLYTIDLIFTVYASTYFEETMPYLEGTKAIIESFEDYLN